MATYLSKTIVPKVDGNGNGTTLDITGADGKYVEITGGFNATYGFEFSFDGGATWRELQSITAATGFFVDEPATHLRVVTTNWVADTDTAMVLRFTQ